jgi:mRNA interferase MazF
MNRGEIWLINLDPTTGAEIKKSRPALIVSSDAIGILPLRIIVPFTDWKDRYTQAAWMVKILPDEENGLSKISAADTFQIRSVSTSRFIQKIGNLPQADIDHIAETIGLVIEIPSPT